MTVQELMYIELCKLTYVLNKDCDVSADVLRIIEETAKAKLKNNE